MDDHHREALRNFHEKFFNAVCGMATSPNPLRARVETACFDLYLLKPHFLPDGEAKIRDRVQAVFDRWEKPPHENGLAGYVSSLPDDAIANLAEEIADILATIDHRLRVHE